MALIKSLTIFSMLILAGCFSEEGGGSSGGGLFSGHKPANNVTTIIPPTSNTYVASNIITFQVVHPFNMTVSGSPVINFDLGGSAEQATYVSGDGTKILTFSYTVLAGDNDNDGVDFTSLDFNGGDITFDNKGTPESITTSVDTPNTTGVLVDTQGPQIIIITPPPSDTYFVNQELNFLAAFDSAVYVTGTPELTITLDSGAVNATYVSGSGSTSLVFRHTVSSSDLDGNGILMNSPLLLNGGSLNDANGNAANLNFIPTPMPFVNVDGDTPWIVNVTYPANSSYTPGQHLDYSVEFSEVVNVNNNPRLQLDIGGVTQYASYQSGSGTNTLSFRYTVVSGDVDNDGVVLQNLLDLNTTGLIRDATFVNADLDLNASLTPFVLVDAILPEVDTITPPTDGTYKLGDVVNFVLNFNTNVDVSGFPNLDVGLTSAPGGVDFQYNAGSGTNSLVMRYVVQAGDEDLDGVTLIDPLDLNGGTIQDSNLTNANLDISAAIALVNTTNIFIDGVVPQVVSITPPVDDDYEVGQNIDFILNFNEPVIVTGGTPSIDLNIEAPVTADYVSGSGTSALTFRYVVQAGDLDTDGIVLLENDISLNGSTLEDNATNSSLLTISGLSPVTTGVTIDGIVPTITSIDVPTFQYYNETDVLQFTVNTSESVNVAGGTPRIQLDIGGSTVYADYQSGTGSTALVFEYTIAAGLEDHDGITLVSPLDTNGATITEASGNNLDTNFTGVMPNTSGVNVDSLIPTVSSVTAPADNTYGDTEDLDFVLNFNENVDVAGGTPYIEIDIDGNIRQAQYTSGTGSSSLTFRYTIVTGEEDTDGIAFNGVNINLNGATINDVGGNAANLDMTVNSALPSTANIFVDAVAPTITNITAPADDTYIVGEDMDFVVDFDENVDITNTPRIQITLTSGTVYADYLSGTGTQNITFRYTVVINDVDLDGITIVSPLDLNTTGVIADSKGNNAVLTHTIPVTPVTTAVLVDGIIPTVTIDTYPNINATNAAAYTFSGTCSENGQAVNVDIGGVTDSPVCTALAWSSTVNVSGLAESADNTVADITITADHDSAGGNPAVQATQSVIKDTTAPTVTTNSIAANTYIIGDTVQVSVLFDEDVTVSGTPRIQLTFETEATSPVYADYVSGTGSNTLIFEYTVAAGDEDVNGIAGSAVIDPNSGSIEDNLNNATDYNLVNTTFATSFVDGIAPTITNVTIAANTYYISDTLTISVTFDDNVVIATATPTIPLTFDTSSGSPTADYNTGSGSTVLTFDYTVTSGNSDPNGLDLNAAINLAGATMRDTNGNDASLVLSSTNFPTAIIDAIVPDVTITTPLPVATNANFTTYPIDGTCSENGRLVTVNIGGVSATPTCTAGTWSASMDLTLAAESADNTVADIAVSADHDDAGGNNAVQATDTIIKDSIVPTVSTNSVTASTYIIGNNLFVQAVFNEDVTVSGTPRIQLNFETEAAGPVYADYSSGSGSNTLLFSYTIVAGDVDTNGIALNAAIDPNSGSIVDNVGNVSDYNNITTAFPTALVDGIGASITNVNIVSNTYYATQTLSIFVVFDENVNVAGGNPEIDLTFETESGSPTAVYNAGTGTTSLTFEYTITTGNEDTDGIDLAAAINLAGATLIGTDGNPADLNLSTTNFPAVLIDATQPTVTINGPLANIINTNVTSYTIDGTCSENGQIVTVDIGGVSATPTCSANAWSTTMDLNAVAQSADNTIADVAVTVDHEDAGSNPAVQATDTLIKDSIVPTISSNTITGGTYSVGDTVQVSVVFNEDVNVSGTPRIELNFETEAAGPVYAAYTGGDGTNTLTFEYIVAAGDEDLNGIDAVVSIDPNGGSITDNITNVSDYMLSTTNFAGTIVDGIVPTVTNVTIAANTYYETDTLTITVDFSEAVTVAGGTPQIDLTLDTEASNPAASYATGSPGTSLTFDYVVVLGNEDLTGIDLTGFNLGVATIQDVNGNNINTTLSTTSFPSVFVDTSLPEVEITSPTNLSYVNTTTNSATFAVSGTCTEAGQTVDILVDSVSAAGQSGMLCNGTTFSGTFDTTGIGEGAFVLDAEITDGTYTGDSTDINITKDTIAPTITIGALVDIIAVTETNYAVSGTCSENGGNITITIDGSASNSGTCSANAYSISVDTSSVGDGSGISVTADFDDDAGNAATQASSTTNKDATIPLVAITFSPNITSANETNYSISGTCSESGRQVSVNIDGLAHVPTCSGGSWSLAGLDVSSRADNANLPITADHTDLAGNNATQASVTVNKTTATPTVTINTPAPDISQANVTAYSINGTCSENGTVVTLAIGSINLSPNCSGGNWYANLVDTSGLPDGPVSVTADHSTAPQASTSITKDTSSSTVTISSAADINPSNELLYSVSGTCSENGVNVDVYIDSLNYLVSCTSGSWTTGLVDVSSLTDGNGLIVTADHDTATQASTTINKQTVTPTVTNLSVPTTLSDSADLSFDLVDPGGFTIDDYLIQYRIKGSPTWLTFADGVSTSTTPTVTGLSESTIYEFQVAVIYDTSNQSAFSNIAEGETQPDDPIFGPYSAMNVGGSTTTTVTAYQDSTAVTLNGGALVTLNKGQTHVFASTQFDVIDADKPIFTAGRRGPTNAGQGANIVWNPTAWAGKAFSFNATRTSPQILEVYAIEDAVIEVKQGSTVLDSATITAGSGTTLTWTPYGSYQVVSTGTILAYHISAGGSNLHDPTPLLPSHTEVIGFPSNSMRITTTIDSTNYTLYHSNSVTASGNLNKQDVIQVNPQGGTTTLFQGDSLIISADQKISGASFADSNGLCSAAFMPTNLLRTKYILPTNSDYIAFASKVAGSIQVLDSSDNVVTTLTLTRSGGSSNAPFKVRMANPNAGYRFVSTVPVGAWYQPNNNTGGADQDESLMFGTND